MRKIIVTGGRSYRDYQMVDDVLDFIKPDKVIHGKCRTGADQIADDWAKDKHIPVVTYEADWNTNGRAAGPLRNREMLENHQDAVVIAFPGNRGTEDCISTAKTLNMVVLRVEG